VRGKAALPTGRWVRVRVECKAGACTLFVDGKQVGSGKIAANRRATHGILGRFQGRLDHVRIYRKVFDDFSTVPAPPGPQWRNGVYTEADVAALQKKLDQVRRTTAERLKNDPEWKRMHDDRNTAHKALDAMIKADPAYVAASERMDETGRTLQKLYQKEIDAGKHKNHEEARQAVRKTPKGAPLWTEHQAAGRKMEDIRKKCRTTSTGKKLWARVEAHGPAVNAYRARVAPEEATIDDRLRAARDYLREPDIPLYTGRTK